MRTAAFCLLVLSFASAAAGDTALLSKGRELTKSYLAGDTATVWTQMDPVMQRFLRSEAEFAKFREQSGLELGREIEVLSETVNQEDGFAIYERTARWSGADALQVMRWEFTDDGTVVGFGIAENSAPPEPAPTRHLDYMTKSTLRLPFDGEWMVFWGGRSIKQNLHVVQQQQRFAYDFAIARAGRMHRGSGESLDDYYCWGAPINAPAGGKVVTAIGSLPDQQIGAMDKDHLAGNHVILDLGRGEYAIFAHLRQGSVRVKAGDVVKSGDELGQCGNSGNTSQPHLHFHVQDSPQFGQGEGLPAFFVDYVADGKPVARGEPVKGQLVHRR